jgi:DNA end-binding protein Ku
MAPRPSWRGYLKLSLVTCPVAMLPATSDAQKVRFHTVNRATGNRVHARYVDAETGKPVDDKDQVKGYERDNGEYVMLEDEELDAVALESRNEPVAARKRLARRRATTSSISWHA